MSSRIRLLLAVLFALAVIPACSPVATAPVSPTLPAGELPPGSSGNSGAGLAWPAYLPAAIPPFEGNLQNIVTFSGLIRLHYTGVTLPQLQAYLAQLEKDGYKLHYVVYQSPGAPVQSDKDLERYIKEGKFDEVQISGPYQLRILSGGGDMDLEVTIVADFADAAATAQAGQLPGVPISVATLPESAATSLTWPENLVNLLPPPADCTVTNVIQPPEGGTTVTCEMGNPGVVLAYEQVLLGQDFVEKDHLSGPNGEIIMVRLEKGDQVVELVPSGASTLMIVVAPVSH